MKNVENRSKYMHPALLWQRKYSRKFASRNGWTSTSGWMSVDVGGQQIFGGGGGGSDSSILPVIGEMRKLRKIIS
jgi:hypothetical protein